MSVNAFCVYSASRDGEFARGTKQTVHIPHPAVHNGSRQDTFLLPFFKKAGREVFL